MSDGALRRFGLLFLDGSLFIAGLLSWFGLLFSIRLLPHFGALSIYGFLLLGGSLSAEWVSCDQRFTLYMWISLQMWGACISCFPFQSWLTHFIRDYSIH